MHRNSSSVCSRKYHEFELCPHHWVQLNEVEAFVMDDDGKVNMLKECVYEDICEKDGINMSKYNSDISLQYFEYVTNSKISDNLYVC